MCYGSIRGALFKIMNELRLMGDIQTMSSREIAELTGKRHDHVLRDCDSLNESYGKMGLPKFGEGYYTHPQNGQEYREYLLTRMQCMDLMTGYNTELRIKVNRRWEELETKNVLDFSNPDTVIMLAQNWKEEQQKRMLAETTIEKQAPKVLFADSVQGSNTNITINDLSKLLSQNGIDIGQNRLFSWMVENKYLIRNSRWSKTKNRYSFDYMPTQKAADLGVFYVTEMAISGSGQTFLRHTVKVTGKGQIYFINKFLNAN